MKPRLQACPQLKKGLEGGAARSRVGGGGSIKIWSKLQFVRLENGDEKQK